MRELEAEVKAMGDKLMYLKEKTTNNNDSAGADMEVFEIMVHKLRKEFWESFAQKHECESLTSDMTDLQEKVKFLENENDRIEADLKSKITYHDMSKEVEKIRGEMLRMGASRPKKTFKVEGKVDEAVMSQITEKFTEYDQDISFMQNLISEIEKDYKKKIDDLIMNKYDFNKGRALEESLDKQKENLKDITTQFNRFKAEIGKTVDDIQHVTLPPIDSTLRNQGDVIL